MTPRENDFPALHTIPSTRSLFVLLSQALVAFTIEFDNEFERQMSEAGYPGALLSLTLWTNLVRFVAPGPVTVRDLAASAFAPEEGIKSQLGCLERWRFVVLDSDAQPSQLKRRDGWGSGRGIRADWKVRLTPSGLAAGRIWPALFTVIERRWEKRFGKDEIIRLRQALQDVADQLEVELPHGLPGGWQETVKYPPRIKPHADHLPLATLLSWLLLTFQMEFDRESPTPLPLCANTLRVLGEEPIREAEIPRRTGASPETSGLGWQIKPYVVVQPDPTAKRGKVVSLSPRGVRAQQTYQRLLAEIEKRWQEKFGRAKIACLRDSLQELFEQQNEDGPLIAQGLVPARGTVRAGHLEPALGRRDTGPAARKRIRDWVAQTQAFLRDPAGTLPHYPLWDMNRGFGP
jgi:hypothetical protein